ncbi:hypothetical protein PIB30_099340, partial [Stylosanthes scabra]|nr:hypothetical protein [Stylosanthes scabra]
MQRRTRALEVRSQNFQLPFVLAKLILDFSSPFSVVAILVFPFNRHHCCRVATIPYSPWSVRLLWLAASS